MNKNLVYAVSFVIVFNCVISVAKHNEPNPVQSTKNETDLQNVSENIFAEGGNTVKSRIMPRKGAVPDNSTEDISHTPEISNIKNNSTALSSVNSTISESISNVTISISTTTLKPPTTESNLSTPTTKKPIRKPTITYSADDNEQILANEKKIDYNLTKLEDVAVPKISPDIDRTIIAQENGTRRNYIYMSIAFTLPVAVALIHISYKKIKNWMDIRHYQRVVSLLFEAFHNEIFLNKLF